MATSLLWASKAASRLRISVLHRGLSSAGAVFGFGVRLVLKDLKYADTHEWVKVDGNSATVGVTDHAQDHLGEVVYAELPEVGTAVKQGNCFGAVESVKATSDIISPVTGSVVEVNKELESSPGLVNSSPYDKGWIIKVDISDVDGLKNLMDSDDYLKFCEEEDKH